MNLSKEKLENLLRETESAHGKYEKELGCKDENWAGWYAKYITDRLNGTDVA